MPVPMLQQEFLPDKAYTHAPSLKRVAVVSAPVVTQKPIAQELNECEQGAGGCEGHAKKGSSPNLTTLSTLAGGSEAWSKALPSTQVVRLLALWHVWATVWTACLAAATARQDWGCVRV